MKARSAVDAAGLLLCTSVASGLRKIAFQLKAQGLGGISHLFHKPIFTTSLSCLANLVFAVLVLCWEAVKRKFARDTWQPVPSTPESAQNKKDPQCDVSTPLNMRDVLLLFIPAANYFACILLAGMGMMLIPASIAFMVQASCIIFTTLCSILFLNRKLNHLHIKGIVAAMAGVVVVSIAGYIYTLSESQPNLLASCGQLGNVSGECGRSLSTVFDPGPQPSMVSSTASLVTGVSLTLASQLAQALQFVSEEALLCNSEVHPLQVMAIEGFHSTILSVAALLCGAKLAGSDEGHTENLDDTIIQMQNNHALIWLCASQFLGVAGGSYFGLRVSVYLGSVFRTVLLSLRTLIIWSANIAIYYSNIGNGTIGERWDTYATPVQCFGFGILLLGTMLYAQGSSAVARDAKTIVKDIQGICRALSNGSLETVCIDMMSRARSTAGISTVPTPVVGDGGAIKSTSMSMSMESHPLLLLSEPEHTDSKQLTDGVNVCNSVTCTPSSRAVPEGTGGEQVDNSLHSFLVGRNVPAPEFDEIGDERTTEAIDQAPTSFQDDLRSVLESGVLDIPLNPLTSTPGPVLPGAVPLTNGYEQCAPCAAANCESGTVFQVQPLTSWDGDGRWCVPNSCLPDADRPQRGRISAVLDGTSTSISSALGSVGNASGSDNREQCLVGRAVRALGDQLQYCATTQQDVKRELKMRKKDSMNDPSFHGTLVASTSWVLPRMNAIDASQHRGASSYNNPFVPQILRNNRELTLERQCARSLPGNNGAVLCDDWPPRGISRCQPPAKRPGKSTVSYMGGTQLQTWLQANTGSLQGIDYTTGTRGTERDIQKTDKYLTAATARQ